ncbi:MAG: hypothetical protein AAF587_01005 [Bacteroidota bacterium]
MTNKLITIVILSLGMIATQKSAALWDQVKAASVPMEYMEYSSHLFNITTSRLKVYPSPETGNSYLSLPKKEYGMALTHCTDQHGEIWAYVMIKKTNGKFSTGWVQAQNLQWLMLEDAPEEWLGIHKKWGWEEDPARPIL